MIYKNNKGEEINTEKDEVICGYCYNTISKEEIEGGYAYFDGDENGVGEFIHESCMDEIHNDNPSLL